MGYYCATSNILNFFRLSRFPARLDWSVGRSVGAGRKKAPPFRVRLSLVRLSEDNLTEDCLLEH